MVRKSTDEIIRCLINVGSANTSFDECGLTKNLLETSGINRKSPDFWLSVCSSLTPEQSVSLFKSLVLAENEFELLGGSVSATIWVLKHLDKIYPPDEVYRLIDWALERNRFNSYCPLGSYRLSRIHLEKGRELIRISGSYLDSLMWEKTLISAERQRLKEQQDNEQKNARKNAKELNAQEHLGRSTSRREKLQAEINLMRGATPIKRLSLLLSSEFPVSAIPTDLFDVKQISSAYSGDPPFNELKLKLGNYKGHWATLLASLERAEP